MLFFVGLLVVLGMVFGGYTLSGGYFDIILHALPFEGMMIAGGSLGAFIISNSTYTIKKSGGGFVKVLKGNKWKKEDYSDILMLMFELTKIAKRDGLAKIEEHIENPHDSEIFNKYPKLSGDHHIVDMISSSIRLQTMGHDDVYKVDDYLTASIKKHHAESHHAAHAIQTMADGLPAIGIVAAVLGVIKTMSSIDKPPEILGALIGGALVGTFLGVFLAYCVVAPVAARLNEIEEEDGKMYELIKVALLGLADPDVPANVAMELARDTIPSRMKPAFDEVEQRSKEIK